MPEVIEYKPFVHALNALVGGDYRQHRAAETILDWMKRWSSGDPTTPDIAPVGAAPRHVTVYQLPGSYLVAIWEHAGVRVPLYIGSGQEVAEWGARHADYGFHLAKSGGQVSFTALGAERPRLSLPVSAIPDEPPSDAPFAGVPTTLLRQLHMPEETVQVLRLFVTRANQSAPSTLVMLCALRVPDDGAMIAIVDALALLAVGSREEAIELLGAAGLERPRTLSPDRLPLFETVFREIGLPSVSGSVFAGRGDQYFDKIGLSRAAQLTLATCITPQTLRSRGTQLLLDALDLPDEPTRAALHDAVIELDRKRPKIALARLRWLAGEAVSADADPEGFEDAMCRGTSSDWLVPMRVLSDADIQHVLRGKDFADWMLFLHPDQMAIVSRNFSGPARLTGVAGSGKTCVLVHRANYLASRYPDQTIRILTLNRSLVRLIESLLDHRCRPEVRACIKVEAMYDYCHRLAVACLDDSVIVGELRERDVLVAHEIDRVWGDFVMSPHAEAHFSPFRAPLESFREGISVESYLRDEMRWVRSGFAHDERQEYQRADRLGRSIPLPKPGQSSPSRPVIARPYQLGPGTNPAGAARRRGSATPEPEEERIPLPPDSRQRVLALLDDWEEWMHFGREYDDEGVAALAHTVRKRVRTHPELAARCVLIDEAQDFSTIELAIAGAVPTAAENGLFLCGDPVQKILPKQQDLKRADLNIPGARSIRLNVNYRNSRRILRAAYKLIEAFAAEAELLPGDILEPQYALRDGVAPVLYECQTREQEVRLVLNSIRDRPEHELSAICVATVCPKTRELLTEALRKAGLPYLELDNATTLRPGLRISDLDHVKGHEFEHMILLDLSNTLLPVRGRPWGERWRDAFRIYVAMTRAREDLSMAFVHNRSILLRGLQDTVEEVEGSWFLA